MGEQLRADVTLGRLTTDLGKRSRKAAKRLLETAVAEARAISFAAPDK